MPESTTIPERKLVISRRSHQGQFFAESLNDTTSLDMMLIPGGSFEMGQTESETAELIRLYGEENYQKYFNYELPRHSVTIQAFFLGKYLITQAQWRAVAAYQPVDRELNPDPSKFKGDNRPVEQVSWPNAQEYCRRLSAKTGRTYRLPSEAEWEYACRAGTTTPFHFGETLSDELANYCAQDREIEGSSYKGTYGRGILGQYRQATTDVGNFPANSFGLYDMHGNVWEWCQDDWHNNYEGAPSNGIAWTNLDQTSDYKLVRGGTYISGPNNCRSASRNSYSDFDYLVGFRVVCEPPRILLSS